MFQNRHNCLAKMFCFIRSLSRANVCTNRISISHFLGKNLKRTPTSVIQMTFGFSSSKNALFSIRNVGTNKFENEQSSLNVRNDLLKKMKDNSFDFPIKNNENENGNLRNQDEKTQFEWKRMLLIGSIASILIGKLFSNDENQNFKNKLTQNKNQNNILISSLFSNDFNSLLSFENDFDEKTLNENNDNVIINNSSSFQIDAATTMTANAALLSSSKSNEKDLDSLFSPILKKPVELNQYVCLFVCYHSCFFF